MTRLVRAASLILAACALSLSGCASRSVPDCRECATGTATWYGAAVQGHRTANGERFDRNALTAAHRSLPLNSRARVVNLSNGRSVVVRITDRGPLSWTGRDIDLSEAAAREIGMIRSGVAQVRIEPL
jgi:rare lipoprotein A